MQNFSMRTDGQADRHEEDNSRSTQIANAPKIGIEGDIGTVLSLLFRERFLYI